MSKAAPLHLLLAAAGSLLGACIDIQAEWPVRTSSESEGDSTWRHAVGLHHGWLSFSTDDVLWHGDLTFGIQWGVHSPVLRLPFGWGGGIDFGIAGVAPWFVAALFGSWRLLQTRRASTQPPVSRAS